MPVRARYKFYLKNAAAVETLGRADTLVFDKTGTLTDTTQAEVHYHGRPLSGAEKQLIATAATQSTHLLSQRLAQELASEALPLATCQEHPGQGVSATSAAGDTVRLEAASFVFTNSIARN